MEQAMDQIDVVIWYDVLFLSLCFVVSLVLTIVLSLLKNVCCGDTKLSDYCSSAGCREIFFTLFVSCLIGSAVICGAIMAFLSYTSAPLFVFSPQLYPEGEWGTTDVAFEEVNFYSGGFMHSAWFMECTNASNPCIPLLYCHGADSNLADSDRIEKYKILLDIGYSILAFDYTGFGKTEGDLPVEEDFYQSSRDAYTVLKNRTGVQDSEAVILGEGIGGVAATKLAGENDPKGLILQSTWANYVDHARTYYPISFWFLYPISGYSLNCVENLDGFTGYLWQYHSQDDELVPYSSGKALFDSADDEGIIKEFFSEESSFHNSPMTPAQIESLRKWTEELRQI
eukprot:TRINITY_DN12818_c0_g1_i1.p1 TRINITY_DN12818_c0_g1~~TRINITY_DN12818_c0_g1_i1.p1  ORF type:complete len:363 (+),score=83.32 TRINITY_DN12818_c0_g1_i1:69-1091(+)